MNPAADPFLIDNQSTLNMERISIVRLSVLLLVCAFVSANAQEWKLASPRIVTTWGDKVDPRNVHPEYPRPQMVRDRWLNLNGLWNYAIAPSEAVKPASWQGKILVPFPVESALSGVGKTPGKENKLWYRRTVAIPSAMRKGKLLLHFGAVDWRCEVFVNGKAAGVHDGGYDPFYFDITGLVTKSRPQEIVVAAWDPTDEGPQPRGKQVKKPQSIWYTPVTGIWQTVWLESVPDTYISSTRHTTDFDSRTLHVSAVVEGQRTGDRFRVTVLDGATKIGEAEQEGNSLSIPVKDIEIWSPDRPKLYDLKLSVIRKGKVVDEVTGYFAMRKISMAKDENGVQRMMLNDKFLFQFGPLDQGWWPDGLYTAPSDEALQFDIIKTKEMGFNMIRKHVKVEPARWYYHCDKLGMLVWQDMPSGDMGNHWDSRPGVVGVATSKDRTAESESIFRKEWRAIMSANYNFPSIVVWVPFNEAWGQFKTKEIVDFTREIDSTRLVNEASGGNFHYAGDILDIHNYPAPVMPDPVFFGEKQILVLGEYGGLGLPIEGHTWQTKDNWGYQSFTSVEDLQKRYERFIADMQVLIRDGLSAAVYTQTTDVEIETNGLMTYDRKVIKMPTEDLKRAHAPLYKISVPSK